MLLSIENLKIGYNRGKEIVELVRGISLDVGEGEVVGLVGESGSGKSLTALAIPQLLPTPLRVLEGKVVFNNTDLLRLSERRLHSLRGGDIGFIFQDPLTALNPTLSVGAQLVDVVKRHSKCSTRDARTRAVRAMRDVGIRSPEHRFHSFPHQMSGGMRQRVLIAMVLLGKPKLIIADEPTTALDVTVQARIIALLRSIRESTDVAIIFISHNLDLVAEFCDRVVVLYGGRVMEQGASANIVEAPRHPYTRALLECIPRITDDRGALRVIQGQPPQNPSSVAGCPFAERCARALPACETDFPDVVRGNTEQQYACWNPEPLRRETNVG